MLSLSESEMEAWIGPEYPSYTVSLADESVVASALVWWDAELLEHGDGVVVVLVEGLPLTWKLTRLKRRLPGTRSSGSSSLGAGHVLLRVRPP